MALTDKQEAFCREYLIDSNATAAATRSGYSERTARQAGSENLSKPDIKARIEGLRQRQQERTNITSDWVLQKLVENVERAMQAQPVLDREGEETGEYRYDGHVANRALELIGKNLGMFSDKTTKTTTEGTAITVYIPSNGR